MLCENCGKEEATIEYRENINGVKKEITLCSNCFKILNLMNSPNMLSYFFNTYSNDLEGYTKLEKVCSKCSYTFDDYLNKGLFGCPNCYNDFSDKIDSLLNKIHGKNRHLVLENKVNNKRVKSNILNNKQIESNDNNLDNINDTEKLKDMLAICIKEEKYEDAAKIRDKIRKLEK